MAKETCFEEQTLRDISDYRIQETERARRQQEERDAEIIARGGKVEVIETVTQDDGEPVVITGPAKYCTIEIRCDTILENMDMLTQGKGIYVPPSGVILSSSRVEFIEGESVYDVLKRACAYADIPLEYSWTVEYNGYYVEGINNHYEFDCGAESGWMYKVNGWYPNFGSSNYFLKDGDIIVWNYTCHGYGVDIGCEWIN